MLSKLPLGTVTSWQHAIHPDDPTQPVFSRDLLEVEILHPGRGRRLFTLFNNHLKASSLNPGRDCCVGCGRVQSVRLPA
jgi:hypothetical protein